MSESTHKQQLYNLTLAMISLAKAELSDAEFAKISIPTLQKFVLLISECVSLDLLTDFTLLRHAIQSLITECTAEETVMQVFTLSIFRLCSEGSNHPLERGIIKQKIMGILPIFESAVENHLIRAEIYDKNADALSHIADNTIDVPEILAALSIEYMRFNNL